MLKPEWWQVCFCYWCGFYRGCREGCARAKHVYFGQVMNLIRLRSVSNPSSRTVGARETTSLRSRANHRARIADHGRGCVMESSLLCLTPAEVRELSGYKTHRAQCCWLDANHLRYVLDRCGRPKVLRSLIEARLGAADASAQSLHPAPAIAGEPAVRPNFSVLSTAGTRAPAGRRA